MWDLQGVFIVSTVLITLGYASHRDIKYREVSEYIWIPAYIVVTVLNLFLGSYSNILMLVISLIAPLVVLALAFVDLIGGADFLALLLIALAHPTFRVLPISMLSLIYSLTIPLLFQLYYIGVNLLHLKEIKRIKCIKGSIYNLVFFGRLVDIEKFASSKFLYPLMIPQEDGYICRASFSMNDEEERRIKELVLNYDHDNDKIWVTPGFPHILFYFIGYVIALITPQALLLKILLG